MVTTRKQALKKSDLAPPEIEVDEERIDKSAPRKRKKQQTTKDSRSSKYTFMNFPPEIRLAVYQYVLEPNAGKTVTPLAMMDLPLPGLSVGILLANREIAREAYEVFGSITRLKLYLYRSTTVTQLERIRTAQPLDLGFDELFGHLPFFKDIILCTGGANRKDINIFDHLTQFTDSLLHHPSSRVLDLEIQLPRAVMDRCDVLQRDAAKLEEWRRLCTELGQHAKSLNGRDGRLVMKWERNPMGMWPDDIEEAEEEYEERKTVTEATKGFTDAIAPFGGIVESYRRDLSSRRGLYRALWKSSPA